VEVQDLFHFMLFPPQRSADTEEWPGWPAGEWDEEC